MMDPEKLPAVLRRLAAFAVLFSAASVGLTGCATTSSEPPPAYQDELSRGQDLFIAGNYAAAGASFRKILDKYPDERSDGMVRLLLADCEQMQGHPDESRKLREKVAQEAKTPELKIQAHEDLGSTAMREERYDEAAAEYRQALDAAAEEKPEGRAHFLCQYGTALQRAGKFADARAALNQVVQMAPDSEPARAARFQLSYPDNFAVQTGAYSKAENASREKDLLAKKGFPAQVFVMEGPKGKIHCVRVGKFPDRRSAEATLEKIRAAKVLPETAKLTVKP